MVAFEDEPDVPEGRRVRYVADEEAGDARRGGGDRPMLSRQGSAASVRSGRSGRSARGGLRRSVDPSMLLPIEYRTLSFQVGETREREDAEARKAKSKTAAEVADLDWHTISQVELFKRLETSSADGLSEDEVKARVKEYGLNTITHPPTRWGRKIFWYFFGGFGSILMLGGILVLLSWKPLGEPNPQVANLGLGIVLFLVFGIQAAFNIWQDFSSSRVMASITSMLPENCTIVRAGQQVEIVATNIVPGDVLLVRAGNKLPADVRFVEISSDAKFDRSILTGESMPVAGTLDSTDDNYLETKCIGLQGTHCISGSGVGIVVSIGDSTVFGRIAGLTAAPTTGRSPLQKEIIRFVCIIVSLIAFFVVITLIIWGAYLHRAYPDYINVSALIVSLVSVGIAFVPEGLPIALTMSLSIVAKTMRNNNVLCKSLKTVETLGTVSIICSDKTGTLTKNEMHATDCCIGKTPSTIGAALKEAGESTKLSRAITQLRSLAALCNAGEFDASAADQPLNKRRIHGDATDQAVLRFSETFGPVNAIRRFWRKRFDIAFNSKNKFMIRIFSLAAADGLQHTLDPTESGLFAPSDDMLLTIKGAPDILLPRCERIVCEDGTARALSPEMRQEVEHTKDKWSSEGKRVILLARKILTAKEIAISPDDGAFEREALDQARTQLTLVGLIGIVDPPRDEIPGVVDTLRKAGIRIFMVTGDFKLTAQAIAAECGIVTNAADRIDDASALKRDADAAAINEKERARREGPAAGSSGPPTTLVISGPELIKLNDAQWAQLCTYDEIVFARTTPEQKLRIVNEMQAREHIVGMTGDGVNDAPSLKAADIGIALGSGSDIAIEASDMVLLDSFAGIVAAVLYGRLVFDNLKKTLAYLLPAGSFSEFWPVFTNIIFGVPQILSSFLMIIICCFTDCAGAIALAFEQSEADVMLRPPRNPKKERLVDLKLLGQAYLFVGFIEALSSFAMAYWFCQRQGVPFSVLWFGYGNYGDLDPDYVASVLNQASSVYFVNLVVMQWFNLMALRTRRLSIFQHPPLFNKRTRNWYLFPAIVFALLMVFIFCYIPQLNSSLGTAQVPTEHFFLPMAFGLAVLVLDEGRKFAVRKWPRGLLAKIAW